MMKDKENILEPLWGKTEEYIKTSFELFKLRAIDKASDIVSTILPQSVILLLGLIFLLFLNLGIAFWLGERWGSMASGFLAVAAFYALCAIVVHFLLRDKLKERIRNTVIKQLQK